MIQHLGRLRKHQACAGGIVSARKSEPTFGKHDA
ncbi:hypothetical protein RLEG3_24425 [Rhizobium leguminosarum bv. trifolii WSM1689]|nr:hypothetical protein RLEG3_24425 [Rhizobium leguminosarum bv. trifolii WSM1689]